MREEIIKMAQECHLIGMRPHLDGIYQESLERFFHMAQAAEREACAKVAEEANDIGSSFGIAQAIRARGQA